MRMIVRSYHHYRKFLYDQTLRWSSPSADRPVLMRQPVELADTVVPDAGTKDIDWRESYRTPCWWLDRDETCLAISDCSCPDA